MGLVEEAKDTDREVQGAEMTSPILSEALFESPCV